MSFIICFSLCITQTLLRLTQSCQELVLILSRYEAEQLPQTVTSHIDPRDFDAQRTDYVPLQDQGTVTAADCIPSRQWLVEFLADFASLRAQLHKYVLPLLHCSFLALYCPMNIYWTCSVC